MYPLQMSAPPFHLLEVTVISAQDLHPAVRSSMETYAVASIESNYKLRTHVDPAGHIDPLWNDKLTFRIDAAALRSETSSITFSVYATRWLAPDTLLGTARVLISALEPSADVRFTALQVRRPSSLRPQGIINIGVALSNPYAKSMPLPTNGKMDEKKKLARSGTEKVIEEKLQEWRGEFPPTTEGKETEHKSEIERKLEQWRGELPLMAKDVIKEKEGGKRSGTERKLQEWRDRSRRTTGKIPWHGKGTDGDEKERQQRG